MAKLLSELHAHLHTYVVETIWFTERFRCLKIKYELTWYMFYYYIGDFSHSSKRVNIKFIDLLKDIKSLIRQLNEYRNDFFYQKHAPVSSCMLVYSRLLLLND